MAGHAACLLAYGDGLVLPCNSTVFIPALAGATAKTASQRPRNARANARARRAATVSAVLQCCKVAWLLFSTAPEACLSWAGPDQPHRTPLARRSPDRAAKRVSGRSDVRLHRAWSCCAVHCPATRSIAVRDSGTGLEGWGGGKCRLELLADERPKWGPGLGDGRGWRNNTVFYSTALSRSCQVPSHSLTCLKQCLGVPLDKIRGARQAVVGGEGEREVAVRACRRTSLRRVGGIRWSTTSYWTARAVMSLADWVGLVGGTSL